MHKSGKGLIALNVENTAQLTDKFQSIRKSGGKTCSRAGSGNAARKREFLAGMTRLPDLARASFSAWVVSY